MTRSDLFRLFHPNTWLLPFSLPVGGNEWNFLLEINPPLLYNRIVFHAGMVELADAPDSKSGGSNTVWVRPPLPAPNKKRTPTGVLFLFGARHLQRPMRGNPALPYSFLFCKSSTVSTQNRPQTQSVLVTSDHRLQRFFQIKTHRASPDAACCCWQKNSSPPFSSPCRNPKHPRLKPGCFPEKVKYVNCV